MGYYANDMVATQTQTGATATLSKSFTRDPGMRLRGATDTTTPTGGTATETRRTLNHYSDDTDSPAWIATSTDTGATWTWERNVEGIDGNLAALQESDTTKIPELQLTNLHGDITATIPDTTGAAATDSTTDPTEFGVPRNPTNPQPRYGWVGGKRRSSDDLADLVLMGVRLYNPATGRFLSTDPVPGGNPNAYTYPLNPIDSYDTTGRTVESGDGGSGEEEYLDELFPGPGYPNEFSGGGDEGTIERPTRSKTSKSKSGPRADENTKNTGKSYPNRKAAEKAAKADAKRMSNTGGRRPCEYRAECSAGGHVHVDVTNGSGTRVTQVRHYRYP